MSANPSKPTLLLEHYLKQLKLPTFLKDYAAVAAVCAKERIDYPGYLLKLSERELIDREKRAAVCNRASGTIFRSTHVCQSMEGNKNGLWTTVVAAAVFIP